MFSTKDIAPIASKFGREAIEGHRTRPNGSDLKWKQIGVKEIADTREFPFFIQWLSADHPSQDGTPLAEIEKIVIADKDQLADSWFKEEILVALRDVEIEWVNPETNDDQSGIVEVHLLTPHGMVVLELIRNPLSFPSYKIVEYSAGKAGQTPNYISSGSWACNRDCVDQHAYSHLDNPKYRELISTFLNPMEY